MSTVPPAGLVALLLVTAGLGPVLAAEPDRDQDGLADAVEDRNGNGRRDPGETDWQNADTDQDGALDGEEVAGRTDPLSANSFLPKRLAGFFWDGPERSWKNGENGLAPLPKFAAGGALTNGTFQGGVHFPAGGTQPLRYAVREPNGRLNVRLDRGSIRLWFKPDWTWDQRPTTSPRLFEVGNYGNADTGWWGWLFRRQDNDPPDMLRLQLSQNVGAHPGMRYWLPLERRDWTERRWHGLTLSYSPEQTMLWHDGQAHSAPVGEVRAYAGDGVLPNQLPPAKTLEEDGFALGSDSTGKYGRLEGAIDGLETFNYPLGQVELFDCQQVAFRIVGPPANEPRLELVRALGGADLNYVSAAGRPWPVTVWRKNLGANSWGEPRLRQAVTESWTDETAKPGEVYEYKLQFDYSGAIGTASFPLCRHFFAGIAMPPQHRRGHVILAVDSTLESALRTDLAQLRTNLVGDGWTVSQLSAPRHDDRNWKANVRRLKELKADLAAAARPGTTNVVFLLGHVVTPYAGTDASDGHTGPTSGPWPCDGYLGYPDASGFTDTGDFPATNGGVPNRPDDGRWDQNFFVAAFGRPESSVGRPPSYGVGRVDFAGMTVFGKLTEAELIARYLAKDFRYRANEVPTSGRVSAHLANPADVTGAHSAQSLSGAAFGVGPATVFNGWNLLDPVPADLGVHFHYAAGKGGQGVADGRTTTPFTSANFARPELEVPVTFRQVWFSYACNWAPLDPAGRFVEPDNWLKASLGWPNHGLATLPGMLWDYSPLGGGAPLAALMTHGWEGQVAILRFQTILGDPTLRLHRVTPPANLRATRSGKEVTLEWDGSPDPQSAYFVYRSTDGLEGFGEPLGPATSATRWTDSPDRLPAHYQVRAARLQVTGSGSFTNLSQGVFVSTPRR